MGSTNGSGGPEAAAEEPAVVDPRRRAVLQPSPARDNLPTADRSITSISNKNAIQHDPENPRQLGRAVANHSTTTTTTTTTNNSGKRQSSGASTKRKTRHTWQDNYDNLRRFQLKHGHLNHPDSRMQTWILLNKHRRNKYYYRCAPLAKEQVDMLDAIGFEWFTEEEQNSYKSSLAPSTENKAAPAALQNEENDGGGGDAGKAVSTQRARRRKVPQAESAAPQPPNNKSSTKRHRKAKAAAAPGASTITAAWAQRLEEARQFRDHHGHLKVPRKDNHNLYQWINRQQRLRRGPCGGMKQLPQEKIDALDAIGFEWKDDDDTKEDEEVDDSDSDDDNGYSAVEITKMKKTRAKSQNSARSNFSSVAKAPRRGTKRPKRQQGASKRKKQTVPTWDDKYEELCEFQARHGHCRVQKSFSQALQIWVYRQKKLRHGEFHSCVQLSQDKIDKLDAIGFEWLEEEHGDEDMGKDKSSCVAVAATKPTKKLKKNPVTEPSRPKTKRATSHPRQTQSNKKPRATALSKPAEKDEGYACKVYWIDPTSTDGKMFDTPSTKKDICFVLMPSRATSTFADARQQIETNLTAGGDGDAGNADDDWVFYVPKLGAVSKKQEVSLGPMYEFLEKAMDPVGSVTHEGDPMLYIVKRDDPVSL